MASFIFVVTLLASTIMNIEPRQDRAFKFKVIGKAEDLPIGTILYLDDLSSCRQRITVDSTHIVNGRFSFTDALKDTLTSVEIRTNDFSHSRSFWLGKSITHIDINGSDFQAAKISGSFAQAEQNRFDSALRVIELSKDQIKKKLSRRSGSKIGVKYSNQLDLHDLLEIAL